MRLMKIKTITKLEFKISCNQEKQILKPHIFKMAWAEHNLEFWRYVGSVFSKNVQIWLK
jgi:hypothetical protein